MIVPFPAPAWVPQPGGCFTEFPSKAAALRCIDRAAAVGAQWPGEPVLSGGCRVLQLAPRRWVIGVVDDGEVIGLV